MVFGRLAHQLVAILVDGKPVEGWIDVLEDEAAFTFAGARIGGVMGVLGSGIEAAGASFECDARLDIHATAASAGSAGVDALDRDLRTLAAVRCGVDGHAGRDGSVGGLLPVPAVGEYLDTAVPKRRQVAVTLGNSCFDDAIVESPTVAVVGESHRGIDSNFFS